MFNFSLRRRRPKSALLASAMLPKPALLAGAMLLAFCAGPAFAQQVDPTKLLELMVQKGLVTRTEADSLIAQATVAPPAAALPPGGVAGDVQTIPYIPTLVRNQIKEELRQEVTAQARSEGWAAPGQVAEWTNRITLFGDFRVRGEGAFMDDGNFDRAFPNFQAINAGGGYNVSPANTVSAPFLNTTEDRNRTRLRARLGLRARIDDGILAEARLATGSDSSPVSTNQTLGGNGELGKYAVWVDRANLQLAPAPGLALTLGRAENPFWTSELLFDDDLSFDGVSLRYASAADGNVSVFGTLGLFPIFNTDFNFGSRDAGAFASKDKYLAAGQIGVDYAPTEDMTLKLAAGYFSFDGVEGETSSPCFFNQDVCDTDATRPQFMQLGNTLFPIRNITPDPANPVGSPEVQLFGLASKFEVLNLHGELDLVSFNPIQVRIQADYVQNLGFDRDVVAARAVNNLGPTTTAPDPTDPTKTISVPGAYDGGDTGWSAGVIFGNPDLLARGDWRVSVGYRHLETDAVPDAFTDSDFHLGGTNSEGFTIGGGYAIGASTAVSLRWLSSDVITGAPYANDVVQLDLSTKF